MSAQGPISPRERLLNQIERSATRVKLNHVQQNDLKDRSHPFIEYRTKIKRNNRYMLNKAIQQKQNLKHVRFVCDRSSPLLDAAGFQLRYTNRKIFLDGVMAGAEGFYHRLVTNASQAANAVVHASGSGIGQAMSSILGMASTAVNKSIAVISSAASSVVDQQPHSSQRDDINNTHHINGALLAEIKDHRSKLHHAAPMKDRSRPFIPSAEALADYNANRFVYKQMDRRAEVLRSIQGKAVLRSLNHVSIARDCSKPNYLPYRVNVHRAGNARREVMETILQQQQLQHVDAPQIDDRSAPRLPPAGKKLDLQKGTHSALLQEVRTVAGKAQM
eukprot:TRINITY_DN1413_c0_g1_i4.p1 TRINITY_DN1413_c0_g1~~TRINITY_DN1413_c0_g1_i4.p1  ORF type:complete len:332 (-),score=87.83 TRINITY_DN1413_c0_g1_i4:60-1055(-)